MLEIPLQDDPGTVLHLERLRDGRIALAFRRVEGSGRESSGTLHLLDRGASLAVAAWLTEAVEDAWIDLIRERQEEPLRTAADLYGDDPAGVERLAGDMLREIPPALLVRALILLLNSMGPEARERLVSRLNRTPDISEEEVLRRRLAEEREAFAYAIAAAALFDALDRGIDGPATAPEDAPP